MKANAAGTKLEWDWYDGTIPANAEIDETAYIETSFSFELYRSELAPGLRIGRGSSTYLGTMFDVGREGSVSIGSFTLAHGVRVICDREVSIGDYSLLSWNVVLMDSYRRPSALEARRTLLEIASGSRERLLETAADARPVRIGNNVWIGFDSCVLPGVTIGEGSIVGARSVVFDDVPPFTVVAGNPARVVRGLENSGQKVSG